MITEFQTHGGVEQFRIPKVRERGVEHFGISKATRGFR